MAFERRNVLVRAIFQRKFFLVDCNADEHAEHGLGDRGGGEAVACGASVLVALGEHGVALEDEEPGVAVRVEEVVEQRLQLGRRCGCV